MDRDSLTKEQAKTINPSATANLAYLHRLRERMTKAGFPPNVPHLNLYWESNGQLMNTFLAYSFRAIGHRLLLPAPPGARQLFDRLAHLGAIEGIGRISRLQDDSSAFLFRGHRFLRDAKIFEWNLVSFYRPDPKAATLVPSGNGDSGTTTPLVTTPMMVVDMIHPSFSSLIGTSRSRGR